MTFAIRGSRFAPVNPDLCPTATPAAAAPGAKALDFNRLSGLGRLPPQRRLVCHWYREPDGRLACYWEPDIVSLPPR